jgi:hypothetical protein
MKRYDSLAEFLQDIPDDRVERREEEVNLALWHHLSAVGAETEDVRWVADIEEGFETCLEYAAVGDRFWSPSPATGGWNRMSLWNPDGPPPAWSKRLYRSRDEAVVAPVIRAARGKLGRRWHERRTTRTQQRWRRRYGSVPDPVNVHRLALAAVDEEAVVSLGSPPRDQVRLPLRPEEQEWLRKSREDTAFAGAVKTYESARARLPVLEPFVRLWAAGAFCFWVVEHRRYRSRVCIVVPRPTVHLERERLHRTDGPAVEWDSGASYWFWEGLPVPRRAVVRQSERARLQVLVRTRNLELRRMLLDRIGYERFLEGAGAELVRQDDYGKLWRSELEVDGELLYVVEVVNSTPEPDGSFKRYFLRVPPSMRSAREAVAWTFGFDRAGDYELAVQT